MKTATAHKKWLPKHGQWVHFVHRDTMKRMARNRASLPKAVPAVTTPIDNTGNATVTCPMLGNDTYGDCGPVMCAHVSQIWTYGQGKAGYTETQVNQSALVSQYEQVSGGDNGTDETMLVGASGIWTSAGGGLAGNPTIVIVDHLDVDVTDVPLTQFCQEWFWNTCMAWSVPDLVLQSFQQGVVYAAAGIPDPNNGHYTPLSDVGGPQTVAADGTNVSGFYRLWTWGAWCWVSPAFVASVQPECFVTFSAQQFSKATGYDSKGRHVGDVAAAWVSIGGNASLVAPVVAAFPPKAQPTPPPAPTPTATPTLADAQQAVAAAIGKGDELQKKEDAISAAQGGLATLYGAA